MSATNNNTVHLVVQYILIGALIIALVVAIPNLVHANTTLHEQQKTVDDDMTQIHEEINGLSKLVSDLGADLREHTNRTRHTKRSVTTLKPPHAELPVGPTELRLCYQLDTAAKNNIDIDWSKPHVLVANIHVDYDVDGGGGEYKRAATIKTCLGTIRTREGRPQFELTLESDGCRQSGSQVTQSVKYQTISALSTKDVHAPDANTSFDIVIAHATHVDQSWDYHVPSVSQLGHIHLSLASVGIYKSADDDIVKITVSPDQCELYSVTRIDTHD